MSNIKKVIAVVLAVAMCLSCMIAMSACRAKDETVLTFKNGDKTTEIKAGVYLCNLLDAYSSFRSQYGEEIQKASQTTAADFDYEKQTLEKKDYTTWVKDECYNLCSQYAFVETEFDRIGLKLTADQKSYAEQYASYYWATGYQTIYELNGVSYASYKEYMLNQYKSSALFDYYYGSTKDEKDATKGSLRPSNDEIKKALTKNYVIADTIQKSLTTTSTDSSQVSSVSDDQKKQFKATLQKYADRLNKGESFATIYKEDNNGTDLDATQNASGGKTKDKYATLYGSADTSNASDYFTDIAKQTVGKAVVLEFVDCYMLVVKQDINTDSYYMDTYADSVVRLLKDDEFTKSLETGAKKLEATKNNGAISFYNPGKIKMEAETTAEVSTTAY